MRRVLVAAITLAFVKSLVHGFSVQPGPGRQSLALLKSTKEASIQNDSSEATETKKKTLGLLTFDLDDTLYPVDKVLGEANTAFAEAMEKFGYENINPQDIVETGKKIREEMDPAEAAVLTHTEIRTLAIRREMENVIQKRKLQACSDDWATPVSDLAPLVVENAKKWAKNAVSESVVQAVLNAWEMERHHAAERNLYSEVVDVLAQIKKDHPGVIVGAVTDGRANPLFMTFTLSKYFDFCMSWEDDQGGRRQFFQELDAVDSNPELTWIYDAARFKYAQLAQAQEGMASIKPLTYPETYDDKAWIHVGDDLAYDVGGSSACGAKTILMELADSYGQSARLRFDGSHQAKWSTSSEKELKARKKMNQLAKEHVDQVVKFINLLPEAIEKILEE